MTLLLQNGQIMTRGNRLIKGDIWIEAGKIKAIGQDLARSQKFVKIIDLKEQLVTAGLVDLHVHFREPGFTYKETIKTGSLAAARGGFTTVCAMPNLAPVPDTAQKFQDLKKLIIRDSVVKIHQYAPITSNLNSDDLVDMSILSKLGTPGFTNDGVGVQTAGTMYLAMKEAKKNKRPIVAHTEDESLLFGGCMHQGVTSEYLGLPGIISATESSQIARDLILAEETGVHYHVCHVSTKESVRLIREAKLAGVKVTCEVCPHHLILTDRDITKDHGQFKMNPPLRSEEDRQALINGLLDGTIDCIATDHAPHGSDEKNQSMTQAPFGIVGSETAFSLIYTEFVKTNTFTLEQVIDWLTIKPAMILNLPAGRLEIGQPADLAIFNLTETYQIVADDFLSKASNTPFLNKEVLGQTVMTLVDGQIVWSKEEMLE
ncbi:dihydroorotase [Vagococcus intermedius]|uniref:Dihydroorotase n=1 Tax=Vagococcus intermedius TaxID=2991418 RepID=A0AAF0CTF1_9ENTE|nr:dihydroorotase [Vagococcus intermedius]WEG72623.1 dihydroorotase [Vagococcus intermedius]WEG74708.1 dihydroorotase [Vagococcus intermedius]